MNIVSLNKGSVIFRIFSVLLNIIIYKKSQSSNLKWLQVTTINYKSLLVTTGQSTNQAVILYK